METFLSSPRIRRSNSRTRMTTPKSVICNEPDKPLAVRCPVDFAGSRPLRFRESELAQHVARCTVYMLLVPQFLGCIAAHTSPIGAG